MHFAHRMNPTIDTLAMPVDPQAAREAAHWLMRLHSGQPNDDDKQECLAWRARHPKHEIAWQRAELVSRTFGMIPSSLGMPTLDRPTSFDRRASLKTLALLIAGGPMVWAAYRTQPWQEWLASAQTATGEIRQMTLSDGTRIALNTDSAIDVVFDESMRLIKLHRGEIHIETAADTAPRYRPFIVQSANGTARALGTRFTVRQEDKLFSAKTHVAVTEGAVELRPADARLALRVIKAGEQGSFDRDGSDEVTSIEPQADAWVDGILFAENTRLADIVPQIARYRSGVLRCDPAIADLRVSGAFQLKDTDNILALLQQSLPIRIRKHTNYWVMLEPA